MDVRFCARQEPLPRGIEGTLRVLQSLYRALSRAPREDHCFLLTKTYMDVGYSEAIFSRNPLGRKVANSYLGITSRLRVIRSESKLANAVNQKGKQ